MLGFLSTRGFRSYVKRARRILDRNWTGEYTRPSAALYPHQWNWDSAFISIGYAGYDQTRAQKEIQSLFRYQWVNGMVPHIVFDRERLGSYFPEPDFWRVPGGVPTSGITQPPLHATACLHLLKVGKKKREAENFARDLWPRLLASHRFFYRHRNYNGSGLVYIRHPWESGIDNSPAWDEPLKRIEVDETSLPTYERRDLGRGVPAEQRPRDEDYHRYVYLVDLFRRLHYEEEEIRKECPFLVADVMFNSVLCRANKDLLEIGKFIGKDTGEVEEWKEITSKAIRESLWCEGCQKFESVDLTTGERLHTATAASFMPLFAGVVTQPEAEILYKEIDSISTTGTSTIDRAFGHSSPGQGAVWIQGTRRKGVLRVDGKTGDRRKDIGAVAHTEAIGTGLPPQPCLREEEAESCDIVILGASGDLTSRKLIPALYNLFEKEALGTPFLIMGSARSPMTDEEFRGKMEKAVFTDGTGDRGTWDTFAASLFYQPLQYDDVSSFRALARRLRTLDRELQTGGNRIFYLALPPSLYGCTAEMLGRVGLSQEGKEGNGWVRIVVEKPFGRDLPTAVELDRSLHESFEEDQIFRIDHYLAKETVQNILVFRFANAIFEPVWNRRYIDYVDITAAETLGVEHRAGYYEEAGVLRDMFQNHMMQLLALTAMEPPSLFEADRVRDEKAKVYRALRPFPLDRIEDYLVLGQYVAGTMDGKRVPGYREEPGVRPDSLTPTYALLKVYLDNWRWQGVPFYLISGKRLAEKRTEIAIQFKEVPHSMFRAILGEHISANRLILGIYPSEKITLTFQTKAPGAKVCLRTVTMDFSYHQGYEGPVLDAYEKLLLDCMEGDRMLFLRQDSVELCWAFLTPILEECETCEHRERRLRFYQPGSWGPPEAEYLRGSHVCEV